MPELVQVKQELAAAGEELPTIAAAAVASNIETATNATTPSKRKIKREIIDEENEATAVNEIEKAEAKKPRLSEVVSVLGASVAHQTVNGRLYLEKRPMFKLLTAAARKQHSINANEAAVTFRSMEATLKSAIAADDLFLYEGRRCCFVSAEAVKVIMERETFEPEFKRALSSRIEQLGQGKCCDDGDINPTVDLSFRLSRRPHRKRVKVNADNSAASSSSSTVEVFGVELEYKHCGGGSTLVNFKTSAAFELIQKCLPLAADLSDADVAARLFSTKRFIGGGTLAGGDVIPTWKRPFVSWKALKAMIAENVYPQALRDTLNAYEAFEEVEVSRVRRDLEKDHVSLLGVDVGFLISGGGGRVYLDIMAAFTLLGELRMAMPNKWEAVDALLQSAGVRHKEAFRRCHKRLSKGAAASPRSHISLSAVRVLAEQGLVRCPKRRSEVVGLLRHVEDTVAAVGESKDRLLTELQARVDHILKESSKWLRFGIHLIFNYVHFLGPTVVHDPLQPADEKKDSTTASVDCKNGTELCESTCGRQYHFTARCCRDSHAATICNADVGYVVRSGGVYLVKCSAFAALGRMYVVRLSDYRKCDRVLAAAGLTPPTAHFVYEDQEGASSGRGRPSRRTHISLAAFKTLVVKDFACPSRSGQLKEAVKGLDEEELMARCANRHSKAMSKPLPAPVMSVPKSPQKPTRDDLPAVAFGGLKEAVRVRREHGDHLYLHLDGVRAMLSPADGQIARLKRRARLAAAAATAGGELAAAAPPPFFPSYFKKGGNDHFMSAECLLQLLEKGSVKAAIDRKRLMNDLSGLIEEHSPASKVETETESTAAEDEDPNRGRNEEKEEKPGVDVLEAKIPYQVVNDALYLEKKPAFQLFKLSSGPHYRTSKAMDDALERAGLSVDDAFLYEGRRRGYISAAALRALSSHEAGFMSPEVDVERRVALISRLDELDAEKESLRTNRLLELASPFQPIQFKTCRGSVFLHTLQLLRAAGFR